MPVLVITAAAVVTGIVGAGTAVTSYACHSVCNDLRDEINCINEESQKIVDKTKKKIKRTNGDIKKEFAKLKSLRVEIYDVTFKKASEITEKIEVTSRKKYRNGIKEFEYEFNAYNALESKKQADVLRKSLLAVCCIDIEKFPQIFEYNPLGSFVSYCRLQDEKENALLVQEQIKAECEVAELECARLKKLKAVMSDSYETIKALDEITLKSEKHVESLFKRKGYDLSKWSKRDIEAVRIMFNLLGTLSSLLRAEVMTKKGNISPKYSRLIGEAQEAVENYI